MAVIAWTLPRAHAVADVPRKPPSGAWLEWRVLVLSFTLFLYSFGYGGITSFTALYADANGVTPKGIYLTTLALVDSVTRPLARTARGSLRLPARVPAVPDADRLRPGVPRRSAGHADWLVLSAIVFGAGFGTAYPVVCRLRHARRRPPSGAARRSAPSSRASTPASAPVRRAWAGSSSTTASRAFGTAAALSALALPYFLVADRALLRRAERASNAVRQ